MLRPVRGLVGLLAPGEQPLELQILGRTLFHAALVGIGAGILGCLFFAGTELVQHVLLERLAGYELLRASGEQVWGTSPASTFRPWLLLVIPAGGALLAGLVMRYAPESRGGGGDATIEAFHRHDGVIRRRVLWVKPIASIATLGGGGSGGREGPTMHFGGALGSTVGRYLRVSARERRVLMVAGVAAGISAVFRAPLGAALIAIEMLYRDDFESEALIPAVLASVIAYSISISVFGQSRLFG
jgi:CIC family chloride channel protein